ncbi:hypothetical protein O6H91_08G047500 [Diphasiastrum complanatum]|uniref:Uncharacterized protein n=1 Tax=Diphasiastrum complanatum TaxID=34168 RepID=A0ACC2CX61_DIPCM|nr:hypothetical protein O6H91_08G047500 [Diphasiastrum complanatum]
MAFFHKVKTTNNREKRKESPYDEESSSQNWRDMKKRHFGRDGSKRGIIKCFYCDESGHIVITCPRKLDDLKKKEKEQANVVEAEHSEDVIALMVFTRQMAAQQEIISTDTKSSHDTGYSSDSLYEVVPLSITEREGSCLNDEGWYLDSAATTHMTYRRSSFFTYELL